jgi:hypothetical protein
VIKKDARMERYLQIQAKYRCRDGLRGSFRDPGLHILHHGWHSSAIVGAAYIRFAQFATEMVKTLGDFRGSNLP